MQIRARTEPCPLRLLGMVLCCLVGTVLCCLVAGQVRRAEAELFAAPQKQEEPFDSPATEQ